MFISPIKIEAIFSLRNFTSGAPKLWNQYGRGIEKNSVTAVSLHGSKDFRSGNWLFERCWKECVFVYGLKQK